MFRPDQLNHVALHISDLERSREFYREVIGLEEVPRPAFGFPGAWFRIGADQELHLIAGREVPPAEPSPGHFALRVSDIKAAEAHLREKGAVFRGPGKRPDGAWQIFIADPDGHMVEITELMDQEIMKS